MSDQACTLLVVLAQRTSRHPKHGLRTHRIHGARRMEPIVRQHHRFYAGSTGDRAFSDRIRVAKGQVA